MVQTVAAIRSLVVPLEQATVLLPGSVVAEIVPYMEPHAPPAGVPSWLIGIALWREQRIPLVALDAFMTGEPRSSGRRSRIAVLKGVSGRPGLNFYGIVTAQIPRLANVDQAMLSPGTRNAVHTGVAADVQLNGEEMLIPDLDVIEGALHQVLRR